MPCGRPATRHTDVLVPTAARAGGQDLGQAPAQPQPGRTGSRMMLRAPVGLWRLGLGPLAAQPHACEEPPSGGRGLLSRSPDGIRTRATALRGRRARPLHNGALAGLSGASQRSGSGENLTCKRSFLRIGPRSQNPRTRAGVPGLEPRLTEPESVVLPITPYPKGVSLPRAVRPWTVNRVAILPAPVTLSQIGSSAGRELVVKAAQTRQRRGLPQDLHGLEQRR